jgi:hypothetical protein
MKKKSLLILGVIGLVLVVGFQLLKTENVSAQTQKNGNILFMNKNGNLSQIKKR